MADAKAKDPLEPPGVDAKPLLIIAGSGLLLIAVFLALLGGFYRWRVHGDLSARTHPFPDPQLETNVAPRAHAVENHGPSIPEPTAQLDPKSRPASLTSGEMPLDRAMAAIAAKGMHAYDPVGPTVSPPPEVQR